MKISELIPAFQAIPPMKQLVAAVVAGKNVSLGGMKGSLPAMVLAALAQSLSPKKKQVPWLIVMDDEDEAGYCYQDLVQLLGQEDVLFFPSSFRRAVKYGRRDDASEILRMETLARLSLPDAPFRMVVSYPDALVERVAGREEVEEHSLRFRRGAEYDFNDLPRRLEEIGFQRTDYVYAPGEFAVRGSILDVYSYASEHPWRIDFFGDEVDSIRAFEVQTQLSSGKQEECTITSGPAPGQDAGVPLTDYLTTDTLLVAKDMNFLVERMEQIYNEGFSAVYRDANEAEGLATPDKERLLVAGNRLRPALESFRQLSLRGDADTCSLCFSASPQPLFQKNFSLVDETFARFRKEGYTLYICADSPKQIQRLRDIFRELPGGVSFTAVEGTLHAGFSEDNSRICCFTDHEIFSRFHKYTLRSARLRSEKIALTLRELMQFDIGDYVVHIDHGIGRFAGLVRIPNAAGSMEEKIKLLYKGDDVVLVSIHSLHKLSKYKGKEGAPPRLSSLGTGAWQQLKERTKRKLKDIAASLIRIYAERRKAKGFAFSKDSFLQQELEASFLYEDTPDQLRVTQEVKADMERPIPMDRLVCGDVGFGKTEIAIRAAAKAVADNKQVAVLVPTTVLALQHYNTFTSRLADYPAQVDYLSRTRTAKQQKEILSRLSSGELNIIIGTHKLIGKNVKFHDLGLLIIDEEQKFGVGVKERLRELKTNVDTLTLTATPIPRTLQFSLMGARDFSVLQTPPPNRYPVRTELHTFRPEIIREAIEFELARDGQVFFVSNRIASLPNLARMVEREVPHARVGIGHGQMPAQELEETLLQFINHEIDVLVSTTIVENGIDIPNANTILVEAAQHFGLADLHQMRGRVGRSNRKAFCYLFAPPLSALPDDARRRLQAIEDFSDLGSGIHLSMQDLDIRGAGNLLGAEQSGFIADLGYETYQKILSEAMFELTHEPPPQGVELPESSSKVRPSEAAPPDDLWTPDCTLDTDARAYLPEYYVPGASERMMLYGELSRLTNEAEVEAFRSRLADRFGALPPEAEELLLATPLRQIGRRLGCERLRLMKERLTMYFVANAASPFYQSAAFAALLQYASTHPRRCRLKEEKGVRSMAVAEVTSLTEARKLMASFLDSPAYPEQS